jgi:hypothetical protein
MVTSGIPVRSEDDATIHENPPADDYVLSFFLC